jgi:hypothetical protein
MYEGEFVYETDAETADRSVIGEYMTGQTESDEPVGSTVASGGGRL